MSKKTLYYLAAFIGGTIGGCIPMLWGASFLSFSSLLFNAAGAIAAIVIIYKFY